MQVTKVHAKRMSEINIVGLIDIILLAAFSSMVAIGILLGTLFLFAISLLINAFLVFDRMKSPKQTKPGRLTMGIV